MSRSDFVAGVRAVLPFVPGFTPFGIIVGVAARDLGMSVLEATGMSAVMFGGAAQLATIDLVDQGAPFGVIVFTALLINLRLSMFSAAIEPYVRSFSRRWKWFGGFLLSTPGYVVTAAEFETDASASRRWFYLGAALPVYVNWVLSTTAGAILGASVPEGLQLDFFLPLVFIFMLFQVLKNRTSVLAAAVGGVVAIGGANLPLNLGLIVATCVGATVAFLVQWGGDRRSDAGA